MVSPTTSASYLIPIPPAQPIRILEANFRRLLYSIQNLDGANSIFVSPNNNVTGVAGPYQGQEIVAGGFVSDNVDKGEVWAIATAAGAVRIVVQETVPLASGRPRKVESAASMPLGNPERMTARELQRKRTREFGRSR